MSVNKVILVGNLGKDPDLRYTPSGDAVVTFSLATTERYKDREGNRQAKTEWHNIVAWRQLAEICGKFLHKGKQIYVEGKIQNRSYDDRDGNKRYISEVVINEMQMLGSRDDNQQGGGGGYAGGQNQSQGEQSYNQGAPTQSQGGASYNQGAPTQTQGGQSYNQGSQVQSQGTQSQQVQSQGAQPQQVQSTSAQQPGGGFEEPVFNPEDEIPF